MYSINSSLENCSVLFYIYFNLKTFVQGLHNCRFFKLAPFVKGSLCDRKIFLDFQPSIGQLAFGA
jgi:hypothetical protein